MLTKLEILTAEINLLIKTNHEKIAQLEDVEKQNKDTKEDTKVAQKIKTVSEELDQMQNLTKIFECKV